MGATGSDGTVDSYASVESGDAIGSEGAAVGHEDNIRPEGTLGSEGAIGLDQGAENSENAQRESIKDY